MPIDATYFKNGILPCYALMMRVAVRILGSEDEAADLVQDTVKRLWEKRETLEKPDSARAFCVVIARNAALSAVRSRSRRSTESLDDVKEAITEVGEGSDYSEQQSRLLWKALEMMDGRSARALTLSMYGAQSDEIAADLNVSPAAARQILSRARVRLKTLIIKIKNHD
ncbi:MAG: sigma-70 family RNA polymerase sigma factor [Muribaculaceae bacterium]|nr:sigma-70 family RNA polymerase sigma factor [Muribaculaceae bacterium]